MSALSDVKVLDLSRLLPGGFCSLLLADFGADVLKVEDTGMGDYIRWSPPYHEGADDTAKSALFLALNRGKRSIRLDLKSDAGREVLLRLVREHDVLLESFRPGVMERLGVGYERLREENPGSSTARSPATARTARTRARSGHDMNYLGLNGLLGLTGDAGGPPVQAAGQIADVGGGALMAAFGILAALRERERSGEGQLVDVSMFDGSLAWLALVAARYLADGQAPAARRARAGRQPDLLPALRVQGRLGHARRARAEVLAGVVPRGGPRGPDREAVRGARLRGARARWSRYSSSARATSGPSSPLSTTAASSRCSASTRRSTRSWCARERWWCEIDQPGTDGVSLLGVPVKLSRTPGAPAGPGPGAGRAHREVLRGGGVLGHGGRRAARVGGGGGAASDARGSFLA